MKKVVKDYHPLEGRGLTRDPMNKDVGVYSASGVYGDASLATVEKGRNVVEDRIRYIVDELRGFILE